MDLLSNRFCRVPLVAWYCVYTLLQAIIVVVFFYIIFDTTWVYSEVEGIVYYKSDFNSSSPGFFNGSSFEGTISKCTRGCTKSYAEEYSDWYNIFHELNNTKNVCYEKCPEFFIAKTMYKTFKSLFNGEIALLSLGSASVIASFIGIFCIVCTLRYNKYTTVGLFFIAFQALFMFIGALVWVVLVKWGPNDCEDFPGNGRAIKLCGTNSPGAIIVIGLLSPLSAVVLITVMLNLQDYTGKTFRKEIQFQNYENSRSVSSSNNLESEDISNQPIGTSYQSGPNSDNED